MDAEVRKLVFGTADEPAVPRRLMAGPLAVDIADGALRGIYWHGTEVLRGVDYPIRDANWGTHGAETLDERFDQAAESFVYSREFGVGDLFTGIFTCTGAADGQLEAKLRLTVLRDTEVNRAGFVVLHPVSGVAGSPLQVTHGNGEVEQTSFPQAISPSQPVFDIATLRQAANGVTAEIVFQGDIFEMEDQRNWSDASYKTYCRPLSLPCPYALAAGTVVEQSIVATLTGQGAPASSDASDSVALSEPTGRKMPEVSLALESGWEGDGTALEVLAPASTLLRLDLTDDDWSLSLPSLLAATRGALDLELIVADDADSIGPSLTFLHDLLDHSGVVPRSVIALPKAYLKSYQPDAEWPQGATPEQAAAAARACFPSAAIGGGVLTNFTELNRYRSAAAVGDFVTHGTSAIVHAADDASVLQTLEALPQIFASAEALAPGKPYRLGLVSIGMRSNPYGAAVADNPEGVRRPMAMHDPRQRGLFGAAWMVGAFAATAASRVDRLAVAAPTGPFGLVEGGWLRPAYHAFAALSRLDGRDRLAVAVPDGVAAVAAASPHGAALIVANLTPEVREVSLPDCRYLVLDVAQQDPHWLATAQRQTGTVVTLGPHAVAFASVGEQDFFGAAR